MKNSNSCFSCVSPNCFLKLCSNEWIEKLNIKRTESLYKKGQYIFNAGDFVNGLYFVKHGKIKVVSSSMNDKEHIVRLATDGHLLGHRGFGGETYPVSAIAMGDSVVCFVDNETITEAFFHNPNLTIKLMLFYSEELRAIEARISYLAQMTVRDKVAFALLYLKNIFGYISDGQTLNVAISRADIASICGTNEAQVVRNLSDFETEKLVAKDGKKIKITNEEGLSNLLNSYNFKFISKKHFIC
jgi:CRP-like cAMP-binding protein